MAKTKPSPNTPQDLFATAVWMAKVINDEFCRVFIKVDENEEA